MIFIYLILLNLIATVNSSNILLMWMAWPSHKYLMSNAANLMCQSGHVVSSLFIEDDIYSLSGQDRYVACNGGVDTRVGFKYPRYEEYGKLVYNHIWNNPDLLALDLPDLHHYFRQGCEALVESGNFEKMKSYDFDVIGVDSYFDECYLYLANYLQKPIVRITYGWPIVDDTFPFGYLPLSYVFHPTNGDANFPTGLSKRTINVALTVFHSALRLERNVNIHKTCKKIKHFSVIEYQHQQSQHLQLNFLDDMMSDVMPRQHNLKHFQNYQANIDTSNYTISDPTLSKVVERSDFVIITFSTGAQHKLFPKSVTDAILNAVRSHNLLTFIVQWSGDQFDQVHYPNLVVVRKLALMSMLGHPNCKLYITACGIAGVIEAVNHRVPVGCIPNFLDHYRNAQFAHRKRFGISIRDKPVESNAIVNLIQEVHNNEKIFRSLEKFSQMLKSFDYNARTMVNYVFRLAEKKDAVVFLHSKHSSNIAEYYAFELLILPLTCLYLLTINI